MGFVALMKNRFGFRKSQTERERKTKKKNMNLHFSCLLNCLSGILDQKVQLRFNGGGHTDDQSWCFFFFSLLFSASVMRTSRGTLHY